MGSKVGTKWRNRSIYYHCTRYLLECLLLFGNSSCKCDVWTIWNRIQCFWIDRRGGDFICCFNRKYRSWSRHWKTCQILNNNVWTGWSMNMFINHNIITLETLIHNPITILLSDTPNFGQDPCERCKRHHSLLHFFTCKVIIKIYYLTLLKVTNLKVIWISKVLIEF